MTYDKSTILRQYKKILHVYFELLETPCRKFHIFNIFYKKNATKKAETSDAGKRQRDRTREFAIRRGRKSDRVNDTERIMKT